MLVKCFGYHFGPKLLVSDADVKTFNLKDTGCWRQKLYSKSQFEMSKLVTKLVNVYNIRYYYIKDPNKSNTQKYFRHSNIKRYELALLRSGYFIYFARLYNTSFESKFQKFIDTVNNAIYRLRDAKFFEL